MFGNLSGRLDDIFRSIKGKSKISESNIKDSIKEIRRALLEADVNYKVVKQFIKDVEDKAMGQKVIKAVSPGQQMIKIVNDELQDIMGESAKELKLASIPPTKIMLVGLQGSGKTSTCGKIARRYQKMGKKVTLVACDVYRPAAVKQLHVVGESINTPVFSIDGEKDVIKIAKKGIESAVSARSDIAIFDTAGRLHIDDDMMNELKELTAKFTFDEILFVADGMTGQDAVNVAKQFNESLEIDGVILTKMDGDARGGAALSIRYVTQKPIKYITTGEKTDALEIFHPDRIANRILGMGDIVSLVEKAQETIDMEEAQKLEAKLRKNQFTLTDFLAQIRQMKKMGPLDSLLKYIPGVNTKALQGINLEDNALLKLEAIICSMTPKERDHAKIINGSRRKRIAKGSGTSVRDVNKLLKQHEQMKKMMKMFNSGKMKNLSKLF